jgi:hypothetical protein
MIVHSLKIGETAVQMLIVVWIAAAKFVKIHISGHIHQGLTFWEPLTELPIHGVVSIGFTGFLSFSTLVFRPNYGLLIISNMHTIYWEVPRALLSEINSLSIYSVGKVKSTGMTGFKVNDLSVTVISWFPFQDQEQSSITKRELKLRHSLKEMALHGTLQGEGSVSNFISYSNISGDVTACDQQFVR